MLGHLLFYWLRYERGTRTVTFIPVQLLDIYAKKKRPVGDSKRYCTYW